MQLTANEVQLIKGHVLNPKLRHMTVRALSLYAQRLGKVFVSGSTWRRLIRTRAWRRPRLRVYPAKPKTGVRATRPNEWWHIDLTVIRLTSGATVYLHAVIDNFSRKIFAWEIADRVAGKTTAAVLAVLSACCQPCGVTPTLSCEDRRATESEHFRSQSAPPHGRAI